MPKHRHDADATRAELLSAARREFAGRGFTDAATEVIVARHGLTRGALYHHFGSKRGLFEAVLEELQEELSSEVLRRAASSRGDHVDQLRAGFRAYLDFALRPEFRQILLVDGPAVLGWDRWHEVDLRYAFQATRNTIAAAMAGGELDDGPVDELAHVLLGAVTHAALEIGRAPSPRAARALLGKVIDRLIEGLRSGGAVDR